MAADSLFSDAYTDLHLQGGKNQTGVTEFFE